MPERRHRTALDDAYAGVRRQPIARDGPSGIPGASPGAARPAQNLARRRGANPSRPRVVDQNDLAASLGDTGNLIERGLGIGHRRDDVLRHHDVEKSIGKAQMLARPSPPAPRHGQACARRHVRAPCAASARNNRRRPRGLPASNRCSEIPVPMPTSSIRPPTRSAAAIEALRPALNTAPKTISYTGAQRA